MPKVLVSDKLSPSAIKIFEERGVEVDVKTGMTPEELEACIGEYDGLAIRSASKVTEKILKAGTNLKVVGRAGIGVDNVNVPLATEHGVVVMNTPFGNAITTAEHAVSMMMALARQIPQANSSTHDGKWEKSAFMGVELTGKTLGVIGCGNIGSIAANRGLGLKMKVVAFDPYLAEDRAKDLSIEKVELDELFARADFITMHTPQTETTKGMINAANLAKMKKGVRIVNCARGGLVIEEDLLEALNSGQVAGAALDVFSSEPAKENVLFGHPNVIATPHLGASTNEAQENVAIQVAEQMSDYLLTGAVTNALNMASVSAEDAPKLKPYMQLAEQLGLFLGQVVQSGLEAVTIAYEGHVAELNTKPLTGVVLEGLLSPTMESVNMVNAPTIAKQRDINITEATNDQCADYHTLIRLTVTTENQTRCVSGTIFGSDKPRVVEINGVPIEAELGEHMLLVSNQDKPGFIGSLGSALGDAGVNIGSFHLGRTAQGEDAIALVQLDQSVEGSIIDNVRSLAHVTHATALAF